MRYGYLGPGVWTIFVPTGEGSEERSLDRVMPAKDGCYG